VIFINNFIANFQLSMSVKNCENRSIFNRDMDKSTVSPFFDSRCIYNGTYNYSPERVNLPVQTTDLLLSSFGFISAESRPHVANVDKLSDK